jgi:hypothetical protein
MPRASRKPLRLRWILLLVLGLPVLGLVTLLATALQSEPSVAAAQDVGHEDVARALSLLRTHDPRRARPGVVSAALVSERDLDVLLGHAVQRWLNGSGRVDLRQGAAVVLVSIHVPASPFGRWLNVDLRLRESEGLPEPESLHIGRLPVPVSLARWLTLTWADRVGLGREVQLAGEVVRRVRFSPRQLLVTYAWQADSLNRLFAGLLSPEELVRLKPYATRLNELTLEDRAGFDVPLVELMAPMFALAAERSAAPDVDAAAENRAALLVLTLYVNGRAVGSLAPAARAWARPRPYRLLLGGRVDFPLHFLVSAMLATEGTTPLSKAIGVYKEVADSRGGSGFSFNDMAANRAGTRFGERAMQAPRELQQRLAERLADDTLLPRVDDLPEFMPEPEFLRRYGGVGAPAYNTLLAEIDRRIDGLAFLR